MQCADIVFNKTAQLLADDQCVNGTGVSAQEIGNLGEVAEGNTTGNGSADGKPNTGGAGSLKPMAGAALFGGLLAWGLM